jgi:NOL1/NOP2/sun family putative RNA methylase
MIDLPAAFVERMTASLGEEAQAFFDSYNNPPYRGIRVNTLKISVKDFIALSPFSLQPVLWEDCGFYVTQEKLGKSPLHAAGLFYVQEPSAMCAAPLLKVEAGERVLDLCSAPGGKGTQLAQRMRGEGIIFLNEIVFDRAKILSQNVERLGITNAVVTCATPQQLAEVFDCYFDKILVDAPCSGEGMFKKEPNAIPEWSEDKVKMCAARQTEILECAQKMLRVGGKIVYSTCTFSQEEDEGQIDNFLKSHKNFSLIEQHKLYPHKVKGEGHFAALMQKNDGEEGTNLKELTPQVKDKKALAAFNSFCADNLKVNFKNVYMIGTNLYALPNGMPKTQLQTLRAGIKLGEVKGDRFEPSHSLAMALKSSEANCVSLNEKTVTEYLSGNVVPCPENTRGWALATYFGYPLGWCKCVNGTAKNHLPKGLRLK